MNQLNKNNNKDGHWEQYWSNGNLWYKGIYLNGKEHGYWELYSDENKVIDKKYYVV
jgi:antitoxin component YwqK of YwqJK toxin-antitoxin module